MEIPHADLSKVTRVVFIEIRSMVVLTTRHTASTGVLSMFADTTMTGGDVAAAMQEKGSQ